MPYDSFVRQSPAFCGKNKNENIRKNNAYLEDLKSANIIGARAMIAALNLSSETNYKNNVTITEFVRMLKPVMSKKFPVFDSSNDKLMLYFARNGIYKMQDLFKMFRTLNKKPNFQDTSGIDDDPLKLLILYTNVSEKSKSSLLNWHEEAFCIYNQALDENKNANPFKVEKLISEKGIDEVQNFLDFASSFALSNIDMMNRKFGFLKSEFNDFETPSDRVEAINYIQKNYNEIRSAIENDVDFGEGNKKVDIDKFLHQNFELAYALYDRETREDFAQIIPYLKQNSKKLITKPELQKEFNGLQTTEDKINMFATLALSSVPPEHIKDFSHNDPLLGAGNMISKIENTPKIIGLLKNIEGKDNSDVENFYYKNCNILDLAYDYGDYDIFRSLTGVIKKLNCSETDLVKYYYGRTQKQPQDYTFENFADFIDKLTFLSDKDAEVIKKSRLISFDMYNKLADEQKYFSKIKPEIEEYIQKDNSNFYVGKSAFDIYKQYHDLFLKEKDTSRVLEANAALNTKNVDEFRQKTEKINDFSGLFKDTKTQKNFFESAKITFDLNEEKEEEHRLACLNLLQRMKKSCKNDEERYNNLLSDLISSKFLLNSKSNLNRFMNCFREDEKLTSALELLIDRKAASAQDFMSDCESYAEKSYNPYTKYLNHLARTPKQVTFKEDIECLKNLQKYITNNSCSLKISSENVERVSYTKATKLINSEKDGNLAFNINFFKDFLPENSQKNVLSLLLHTYKPYKTKITEESIKNEIYKNFQKTDDSYANLGRLFNIDETSNLDSNNQTVNIDIPQKFVNFVKSNDWLNYSGNKENIPNLTLHARMRLIDRFALNGANSVEELYTDETKEKLLKVVNAIYGKTPEKIIYEGAPDNKYVVYSRLDNEVIKSVFTPNGQLVTAVKADNCSAQ